MASDGAAAEHGRAACEEAARKMISNHDKVLADLTRAVRQTDLRLGFYYCDCEWGQNDATTPWPYPLAQPTADQLLEYSRKIWLPDMTHLATAYEPDFFFPDFGAACGFNSTTLRAREFLAWLYTNSSIRDRVIVEQDFDIPASVDLYHRGHAASNYRRQAAVLVLQTSWRCEHNHVPD